MKLKRKYIGKYCDDINVLIFDKKIDSKYHKMYDIKVYDKSVKGYTSYGKPISTMQCFISDNVDCVTALPSTIGETADLIRKGGLMYYTLVYIDNIRSAATSSSMEYAIASRDAITALIKYFSTKCENMVVAVNIDKDIKLFSEVITSSSSYNLKCINNLYCCNHIDDTYIYTNETINRALICLYNEALTSVYNNNKDLLEDYNKLILEIDDLDEQLEDAKSSIAELEIINKTAFIDGIIDSYRNDIINAEIASKIIGISKSSFYKKYKKNVNKPNSDKDNNEIEVVTDGGEYGDGTYA